MTTRDTPWPPGTPCWVDLIVKDVDRAAELYGELFGWEVEDSAAAAAGYRLAFLAGRPVAGIGPGPQKLQLPSVWTTYLATADADQTARRVMEEGGSLLMEPFDVLDAGRMAVGFDPSGSAFGLWEAKAHLGSSAVNEPGALIWSECMTRDYDGCREFYRDVFGHESREIGGDAFRYSTIAVHGRVVGGIGELTSAMPAEVPSHWMTYFGSADVDASVEQAVALGAVLRTGPMDSPHGRLAVLEGFEGEIFSVISVPDEDAAEA